MRNGASQPGSAASASSDRSGHGSPSARRRNMTRSRHCLTVLVHGRRASPSERTPRARASARRFVLRDRERLLGEHERAEPAAAARPQGRGGAVEGRVRPPSRSRRRRPSRSRRAKAARRARMRAEAARPAISPMARNGSPASASCASSAAARPLAIRNSPRLPRAIGDAVGIGGGEQRAGRRRAHPPLPAGGERAACLARSGDREDAAPLRRFAGEVPAGGGGGNGAALAASPRASRRASSARGERSRRKASSRVARSTESPPSPRSVSTTAISLAVLASPARAASTTMRARRGGSARRAIARPSSVMRPSPSSAPIARQQRARFGERGARRGIEEASVAGSATPQSAQSSRKPERSAERISGAA